MIAIKGMAMPQNCLDCPFLQFEYGNNVTLIICEVLQRYMIYASELYEALSTQKMKDCPLIECIGIIRGYKEHNKPKIFDFDDEVEEK